MALQRIFISYGRADAKPFSTRLATDLRNHGHTVWMDETDLRPGRLWDATVEREIKNATIVAAVITTHSVREASICRDEIAFALNEGKRIIPLRLDSPLQLREPLLLTRRQWIDFSVDYHAGLADLIPALESDASMSASRGSLVTGELPPLEFSIELAKYAREFVGRGWLRTRIETWLGHVESARGLILVAEPGFGKSAIAASISQWDNALATYFCTRQNSRSLDPFEFVATLVYQLQIALPAFADQVVTRAPQIRRRYASDAFRELIVDPLRSLESPAPLESPLLMVVDGLDEGGGQPGETVADVLFRHLVDLPAWLRIIGTSRPDRNVLQHTGNTAVWELGSATDENLDDLRNYVCSRLVTGCAATQKMGTADLMAAIETAAQGNFLYARHALDEVLRGDISLGEIGRVKPGTGIAAFYADRFARRVSSSDQFQKVYRPMLTVLVAAAEPVGHSFIDEMMGEDPHVVALCLERLGPYLKQLRGKEETQYELYHSSLRDWLTDRHAAGPCWCPEFEGHQRLAECGWQQYQSATRHGRPLPPYFWRNLPHHLLKAKRLDDLLTLIESEKLDLLGRWVERGAVEEGQACLSALVEHLSLRRHDGDRVKAAALATQMGRILSRLGDYERAAEWQHRARALTSWYRGRRTLAIAIHELGSVYLYRGRNSEARREYLKALTLARLGWPVYRDEMSANLLGLSSVAKAQNRLRRSLRLTRRAIREATKAGDTPHVVSAHRFAALVYRRLGEFAQAQDSIRLAFICCALGRTEGLWPALLTTHAWIDFDIANEARQRPVEARESFERALEAALDGKEMFYVLDAKGGLGWCAIVARDTEEATRWFTEAYSSLPEEHKLIRTVVVAGLAAVAQVNGRAEEALRLYAEAADIAERAMLSFEAVTPLIGLGAIQWHAGQAALAKISWNRALDAAAKSSPRRRSIAKRAIEICQSDPRQPPT